MAKLITRPDLASILMARGYKGTPTVNPYENRLTAWFFDLDSDGNKIVSQYYAHLNGKQEINSSFASKLIENSKESRSKNLVQLPFDQERGCKL